MDILFTGVMKWDSNSTGYSQCQCLQTHCVPFRFVTICYSDGSNNDEATRLLEYTAYFKLSIQCLKAEYSEYIFGVWRVILMFKQCSLMMTDYNCLSDSIHFSVLGCFSLDKVQPNAIADIHPWCHAGAWTCQHGCREWDGNRWRRMQRRQDWWGKRDREMQRTTAHMKAGWKDEAHSAWVEMKERRVKRVEERLVSECWYMV